MTRPVRIGEGVDTDIGNQLDGAPARDFRRYDLAAASALLARDGVWEALPSHGGGRRLTVEGITVGAFHLFVAADPFGPERALVVYAIDIWPDGFPA